MSQLTDTLQTSLDILLASGQQIPALNVRNWGGQVIGAIAILEARARGNEILYTAAASGAPDVALGLEGDLGINKTTGDFYQFTGGQFEFIFNGLGRTGAFAPIAANAFGTHPAFGTQRELDIWLLQYGGTGTGGGTGTPANTTPDPPTVSFNASTRVLSASHPLGTVQLEYRQNGGTVLPYGPLSIDSSAHAAGTWQFRVKAATGRNVSNWADSPQIQAASGSGYDTTLTIVTTGVSVSASGVVFSGSAGAKLEFNAIAADGNLPIHTDLSVGGTAVAGLDFSPSNTGRTFRYTSPSGTPYISSFQNVNTLAL